MKYCNNCGKEIESDEINCCSNCGTMLPVSKSKKTKVLVLYEFLTLFFAVLLLIFSFTVDFFSKEVESKLGSGYLTVPVTTTRHYSFWDAAVRLDNGNIIEIIFPITITVLLFYCFMKLIYIIWAKTTVTKNNTSRIHHSFHITFFILSALYTILFIISNIIIFNLNSGLKPDVFLFLHSLITLGMLYLDLVLVKGKAAENIEKKNNE